MVHQKWSEVLEAKPVASVSKTKQDRAMIGDYYTCLISLFSRTTWVSWYQKDKPNLDFTEAEVAVASAGPYASRQWFQLGLK